MHQGDDDDEAQSPPIQRPPPAAPPIVLYSPAFPASSSRNRHDAEAKPTGCAAAASGAAASGGEGDVESLLLGANYVPSDGVARPGARGGLLFYKARWNGLASLRAYLVPLVNAPWFGQLSTGLVLLNMVVMCMPYTGQPDSYGELLEQAPLRVPAWPCNGCNGRLEPSHEIGRAHV